MKNIRRYYTRKQVAELLGVKSHEVTSRLIHLQALSRQEIRRQLKRIDKLHAYGKYTDYHLYALKEYYNDKPTNHEQAK